MGNNIVPWAAFALSLVAFLLKWWQARDDRARRIKAEADLKEITRRGRAPFLRAERIVLPQRQFQNVEGFTEVRAQEIISPGGEVERISVDPGYVISLEVANDGESVRAVTDDWEQGLGFFSHQDGLHQGDRASKLSYKYDPAKHGQVERITISFETMDGLKQHQTYEARHGFCELRRVDPA